MRAGSRHAEARQGCSGPKRACICRLIAAATEFSKEAGCYKVILDCAEDNVEFYAKCGLTRKEVQMVSSSHVHEHCSLPSLLGVGVICDYRNSRLIV